MSILFDVVHLSAANANRSGGFSLYGQTPTLFYHVYEEDLSRQIVHQQLMPDLIESCSSNETNCRFESNSTDLLDVDYIHVRYQMDTVKTMRSLIVNTSLLPEGVEPPLWMININNKTEIVDTVIDSDLEQLTSFVKDFGQEGVTGKFLHLIFKGNKDVVQLVDIVHI